MHVLTSSHSSIFAGECPTSVSRNIANSIRSPAFTRSAIRLSRGHISTALESSGGVYYITASDALHLVMQDLDVAARPWKPVPSSSLRNALELICRPYEVWRSVAIVGDHYASSQHPPTSLCYFTWPTTLWLSCNHSQIASTGLIA